MFSTSIIPLVRAVKRYYSTSDFFQSLAKRIINSRLYRETVKFIIGKKITTDRHGPFNLVIETSNICNARCVMCPHQDMKRKPRVMDKQTFDKICEKISQEKLPVNKVFLSGMGEPLTDPDLVNRIKKLKKLGIYVKLYTNASLLDKKHADGLVRSGLDEINISFNSDSPATYKKIMGLDYAKTKKNIDYFLKRRIEFGNQPKVNLSLVVNQTNESELGSYVNKWSKKADSVSITLSHDWGGQLKARSVKNIPVIPAVFPCRSLWHTLNIDSSGNFVICCRDFESQLVLGNIKSHRFGQILDNRLLRGFRQKHLCYDREKLPVICRGCNFPYQGGVEWFLPRFID